MKNNQKVEVISPDLDGMIPADEQEIEFRISRKEKLAPDILREVAHFLETVADYYNRKSKEVR